MVASAHPLASQVGVDVLAHGGNAFDAAVAAAAALNVVEPFMSGLAGMGYATMWVTAERRLRVLDFVPRTPRSFSAERFEARAQLARGHFAVAAPGNLSGWCMLRDTYGVLPLAQLLEPAARLAEAGFAVGRYGAGEINEHAPGLAACPVHGSAFHANYKFAQGIALGDTIPQPDLARTLRQIGAAGEDAVYRGPLGERIVDHLAAHGSSLTMEDLAQVRAVWREPVAIAYRGLVVHVPPPPCEGFQSLLTLRILEDFDLRRLGHGSADHLDLMVRAVRLAASVRIADGCPNEARLADLLSDRSVGVLRSRLRAGEGTSGQTEQ